MAEITVDLRLESLLKRLESIPAQSNAALRVVQLVNSGDSSARDVGTMLSADLALLSRVLRMANSPYYGLSGRVSNATTAVTVLGFTTVGSLAAAAVARLNDRSQLPEGFWDQAMRVAVAAGLVARSFSVQPADAFCAGVLMDVGSALLFQADPKGYDAVAAVPHRGTAVLEVEQQRYGMTHADVAQRILGAWRFPHPMCGAIGRHHDHLASGCDALSRVLALAQLLADTTAIGALDDAEVSMLSDGRMTASYAATLLPRIEAEAVALAEAMTT